MVAPTARRRIVSYLQDTCAISQRRACGLAQISRKALRHRSLREQRDAPLIRRLKGLGEHYPRYGYPLLHGLLKAEGLVQNPKRTYRLYSALGMQVRIKRRKKLVRTRVPIQVPTRPNERWSADFVHDQLADGRRIRILNIVDDFSRVCVAQLVDTSISGQRTARLLDQLAETRGLPKTLNLDNRPEFTSKALFFWGQRAGVKLPFIQPGKPTQNAFVESFNGRFRDGCLNQHWFKDLDDARRIIAAWRTHYNEVRPHSALGYTPPARFEKRAA